MNEPLLRAILKVIDQFEREEMDLCDAQQAIESNVGAMEGTSTELMADFRGLDADLERIQHAMLIEDQRDAALQRLQELRSRLLGLM